MFLFVLNDTLESVQMSELSEADIDSVKNGYACVYRCDSMGYFYKMNEFGEWKPVEVYE